MAAAEEDPANSRRHPQRVKNARQLAAAGFVDHAIQEYLAGEAPDLAAALLVDNGRTAEAIHLLDKFPDRAYRIQSAAYRKRTGDDSGAAQKLSGLGLLSDEESARFGELSMAERPQSGSMRRPAQITPRYEEAVTPPVGDNPVVQVELHHEASPEEELARLRAEAERRATEVAEARLRARERAAELARAREVAKRAEAAGKLELELDSDLDLEPELEIEVEVEVDEPVTEEEDFFDHGVTLKRMPAMRERKATPSASDSGAGRARPNGLRRPSKPMQAVSELPPTRRKSGVLPRATSGSEPPSEAAITASLAHLIESGRTDAAAKVAQAAGRHAAAVAWFEQVGDDLGAATSLAALGLHGQALEALGPIERSDERYRQACRLVAISSAALGRLDDAHLAQLGPYIDSGPRSDQEVGSFLDLAEMLWARDDRKRAQRCLHSVLRMNPQNEAAELMQLTWAAAIAREKKERIER